MSRPFTRIHLITQAGAPESALTAAVDAIQTRYGQRVRPRLHSDLPTPGESGDLWVCLLDDVRFATLWQKASAWPVTLLPLPWDGNPATQQAFGLDENVGELLAYAEENPSSVRQALVVANDETVLNHVRVGLWLDETFPLWRRLVLALRGICLIPYRLVTAKGRDLYLAALNMELGEESWMTAHHPEMAEEEARQGRVTALVHAPTSRLQLLARVILPSALRRHRPPRGVGYVKSHRLRLTMANGDIAYRLDGRPRRASALELIAHTTRCKVPTLWGAIQKADDKERSSLNAVPTGEEAVAFFTRNHLPLASVATEQQFAELFTTLRRLGRLRADYLVLTLLSTLLTAIGLYQDSAPVIIGAMILAPLMDPIVALAVGIIRFDRALLRDSSLTLGLGIVLVLTLATLFSASLPVAHLTDEIRSRLHPTLLDLGVALAAGVAAAYVHAKKEVGTSLAGVAIAVALVPPLVVAGLGIGLGMGRLFTGAGLLFLANLVGILTAAGLTFYFLGFASLRYARLAFLYKFLLLAAIAIPLAFTTRPMLEENRIYRDFQSVAPRLERRYAVRLELVDVDPMTPHALVRVRIAAPRLTPKERDALVRTLGRALDADVEALTVSYYPRRADTP